MGDGNPSLAYGEGEVSFINESLRGKLSGVLWVPKLKQNLFSVRQAMSNKSNVHFDTEGSKVTVIKDGETRMNGYHLRKGLYALILKPTKIQTETLGIQAALVGATLEEWHKRFAHYNQEGIQELIRKDAVDGLNVEKSTKSQCEDCVMGKICKVHHPSKSTVLASENSAVLHIDTCGPMQTQSLQGNKHFILGIEEYSGYKIIYFAEYKDEIANLVKLMVNRVELESQRPVKMLVTDNGTEYKNRNLSEWLKGKGIIHDFSAPYTPQQNGLAERSNRTIIEGTRTLLHQSALPETLWEEAARTVVYASNRTLSKDKRMTKYQKYFKKKPNVSNMRTFGQWAILQKPQIKHKNKWDPKGFKARFVGYTDRSNTYRFYDNRTGKIITSCDAVFLKLRPVQEQNNDVEDPDIDNYVVLKTQLPTISKNVTFASSNQVQDTDLNQSSSSTISYINDSLPQTNISDDEYETVDEQQEEICMTPNNGEEYVDVNTKIHREIEARANLTPGEWGTRPITENLMKTLKPLFVKLKKVPTTNKDIWQIEKQGDGDQGDYEEVNFTLDNEPRTLQDAMQSPDWPQWKQAMDEEIKALNKNNTWELINKPDKIKPIKSRWVFKVKLNPDGSVERYKARLVAKGYSQIPNRDYKETYAPVASMNTIRILFAVANQNQMEVLQFDVKTAFLHGDLNETIYMEHPEGYENKGNKVCRLIKSLYGLKQAPRQWNVKFHTFLKEFNLNQSVVDKCLYFNEDKTVILVIYVDDGLVAAKDTNLLTKLIDYLKENLELKVMSCEAYLGFQVIRDTETRTTRLHQTHYVDKILEKYGMTNCKPIDTPEEVGVFNSTNSPKLGPEYPFKEVIGSLLYLVTCTRPDIAHAVSIASRTSEPTIAHWKHIKRILRYLKETRNEGICFRWEESPELVGYSDADYANDVETRRSTTGYCILYGNAPVAWRCQRQNIVSLSTTEAEYISGSDLVKELLPIRSMLIELDQIKDEPVKVFVDNQSTICIAKDEGGQQRTKHIDVRNKWLTEQQAERKIDLKFVPGEKQVADMLTKPLHKNKFIANKKQLMTALTTLIFMLGLTSVQSNKFSPAKPVHYEPTGYHFLNGNKEVDMYLTIMNPCKTYFKDITPDQNHNKKLIADCNQQFLRRTSQSIKICKNSTISFNHKREISIQESIIELGREKRAVPVVLLAIAVLAGSQAYTIYRSETNAVNVGILADGINDQKRLLEQGLKSFNVTRQTIHGINDRLIELEKRIDFIDEKLEQYPKIVALVRDYDNYFLDVRDALTDIDQEAKLMRVSKSLLKLIKDPLWIEPAERWSSLKNCAYTMEGEDFKLKYEFSIPQIDLGIKILRAEAFRFWNYTAPDSYCWMKYAGPRFILANITNGCYLDVQEYWMKDDSLRGHSCNTVNGNLEPIVKLYHQDVCHKAFIPSKRDIQVIQVNGFNRIYCYGHNITVKTVKTPCPDYIFELPLTESYELADYQYESTKISSVVINTLDLQINQDITKQLKTEKIKIYGTNLTILDTEINTLQKMLGKIGANITLSEGIFPEILINPLGSVLKTLGNIWNHIQKGIIVVAGLTIVFLLVLTAPLLQATFIALKIIISPIRSLLSKVLRKTPVKRKVKKNKYWDDEYSELAEYED